MAGGSKDPLKREKEQLFTVSALSPPIPESDLPDVHKPAVCLLAVLVQASWSQCSEIAALQTWSILWQLYRLCWTLRNSKEERIDLDADDEKKEYPNEDEVSGDFWIQVCCEA